MKYSIFLVTGFLVMVLSPSATAMGPEVPLWQGGVNCPRCQSAAGGPVCGLSNDVLRNFSSSCELERHNCIFPRNLATLKSSGLCTEAQVSQQAVPAVTSKAVVAFPATVDVSNHRNLKLINPKGCGPIPLSARIQNGQDAGLNQYPWNTLLDVTETMVGGQSFQCGGSLINNNYILTAAHCTTGYASAVKITATIGEYDQDTLVDCATISGKKVCNAQAINVVAKLVLTHPQYDEANNHINDIALLRLKTPVVYSASIKPICLPVGLKSQTRTFNNENLIATGWGADENGDFMTTLQMVKLPGVLSAKCSTYYTPTKMNAGQICAGGVNVQDVCSGDSGGPLMAAGSNADGVTTLIHYGLVSYGGNCGDTSVIPGVYSRTGYYMKWILDNITV